jgi:hypothetical protein
MSRLRPRRLVSALTLIAVAFLSPVLAKAVPREEVTRSAVKHQETTPGPLVQAWRFLSSLVAENGSILDLDDAPRIKGSSSVVSGDNGSGLDPNG